MKRKLDQECFGDASSEAANGFVHQGVIGTRARRDANGQRIPVAAGDTGGGNEARGFAPARASRYLSWVSCG